MQHLQYFSQWGYWGGAVTSNFGGSNRVDLGQINFWVAGQPTVTIPSVGTATYSGSAIGAVNNDGDQYLATGTFTNAYNFGSRSGNFGLTFDGFTLNGSVTPTGNSGGEYTTASGFTAMAAAAAAVFSRARSPAKSSAPTPTTGPTQTPPETGGNFVFSATSGNPYLAAGVFLGHR